jgi:hypothetical protein
MTKYITESDSIFQGILKPVKCVKKRSKCVICGRELTLNNVRFFPTFEIRMYCGRKSCLLKWLKTKGYDIE